MADGRGEQRAPRTTPATRDGKTGLKRFSRTVRSGLQEELDKGGEVTTNLAGEAEVAGGGKGEKRERAPASGLKATRMRRPRLLEACQLLLEDGHASSGVSREETARRTATDDEQAGCCRRVLFTPEQTPFLSPFLLIPCRNLIIVLTEIDL